MTKGKVVESILKITKADSAKYFDTLIDMKVSKLEKLLKICTLLK